MAASTSSIPFLSVRWHLKSCDLAQAATESTIHSRNVWRSSTASVRHFTSATGPCSRGDPRVETISSREGRLAKLYFVPGFDASVLGERHNAVSENSSANSHRVTVARCQAVASSGQLVPQAKPNGGRCDWGTTQQVTRKSQLVLTERTHLSTEHRSRKRGLKRTGSGNSLLHVDTGTATCISRRTLDSRHLQIRHFGGCLDTSSTWRGDRLSKLESNVTLINKQAEHAKQLCAKHVPRKNGQAIPSSNKSRLSELARDGVFTAV